MINRPSGLNPLDCKFPEPPRFSPIWPEILEPFGIAQKIFFDALNRLQREAESPVLQHAADAMVWVDRCLRQHTKECGPAEAARICLRETRLRIDLLADSELVFLMAANRARKAAESMVELAREMQDEASAAGIDPEDNQALERLRARIAAWERSESRYYAGQLADARELLALADKEAAKEAAKKAEEKAAGEREAAAAREVAMAPDAERGKEQRARLAEMQDAAKLANTIYLDACKEEWREYDRRNVAEATRTLNDSDRVRAVLQEFELPKTASRTVLRALIGK